MDQPVKYYMDEHVAKAVIRGLRQRGVDVRTAPEAGLLGASDEEHLQRAHAEARVIFTQDHHFLRLHASRVAHSGIVYATQQATVREIIRGLMLIYQVMDGEEMNQHVEFL